MHTRLRTHPASGVPRALFFGGANEEHLTRACFRWREWGRPQARTALEEKDYGVPAPFNNRGDVACPEVGANDNSTACSLAPLAGRGLG